MAQMTMYPVKDGSPQTTILSTLSDSATEVTVTELACFPAVGTEGANLVTFWDDTTYETCEYTAKSSASGIGTLTIVRSGARHSSTSGGGIEWPAGTKCARTGTGYDFTAYKNNIEDLVATKQPLDATLTALAGVTTAAGKYPYFSGVDAAGVLDLPSGYNYIINPCFEINQQGVSTYTAATTPANSDDTYLMDQWILLSDGNDVVDVSLDTSGAFAGCRCSLKAEVETANKKFGFLQLFESVNSIPFRNQVISVSFKAKTVSDKVINNLRCAVLEWTGTADDVTSDCVSAWGTQGTNPTWATSWTALNTPANLSLTTSEQTFKIENVTIGASTNNVAIFIWCDDTNASVDDLLYLSAVKLEMGIVATPCIVPRYDEELRKCMRFFQIIGGEQYQMIGLAGMATSATSAVCFLPLLVKMRAYPTLSFNSVANFALWNASNSPDATEISIGGVSGNDRMIGVEVRCAGGLVEFRQYIIITKGTADVIKLNARL